MPQEHLTVPNHQNTFFFFLVTRHLHVILQDAEYYLTLEI